MEQSPTSGAGNSATRILDHLPAYASYLLENQLDGFVREMIRISREEDVPLLRYFASFPEEELVTLGKKSNTDFLGFIARNEIAAYIGQSTKDFVQNRLPNLDREDILAEDITIVSMVRRKVFLNFLGGFATDRKHFVAVMEDIDRFTAASEAASFNAYLEVQQGKINTINTQLGQRQEELLEAQELSQMGSFLWDMHSGHSTFTAGVQKIFDLQEGKGLAAFMEFVHPADQDKVRAAIQKSMEEDGLYECEYTYIKDNIEKRIWSRGKVSFDNGKPQSMKGTVMDITARDLLHKKLRQSEDLHKQAQALTHIGNWSWNIGENKILWSDEMYRIYGLTPQSEEITFERFMSFIHPDDREKRKEEIELSLQTGEAADYILKIVNPGGAIKMLKGKGEVVKGHDGKPVALIGTCQDVTPEYLLTRELQEKEQTFRQLISNAPDAVVVINTENIITLWNPKAAEIFGWTAEEVTGKTLSETIVPERYREAHEHGMKRFLRTGEIHVLNKTLELTARNKFAEEFYISLTISITQQNGKTAFVAFIRDISLQKQVQLELEKKTELLEFKNLELERINEELESFNFVASHDLQEPLRKIQLFGSRILDTAELALQPKLVADLEKIMNASARMQNLISDLLGYSQDTIKSQDTEPIDLNALMEEIKGTFLHNLEEKQVQIHIDALPTVRGVPFQFLQLFINLFSNAIKYQAPGVRPEIRISSAIVPGESIKSRGITPSQNYLLIDFADNGIGFEPEHAEKIFDLFTRLHGKGHYAGTGIGLATCKKIVHNHQGFIRASSVPGNGATFSVYLPEELVVKN